jgi:hypothetical protein
VNRNTSRNFAAFETAKVRFAQCARLRENQTQAVVLSSFEDLDPKAFDATARAVRPMPW